MAVVTEHTIDIEGILASKVGDKMKYIPKFLDKKDYNSAAVLLQNGADPFLMIDKKGRNGVTIALDTKDTKMLNLIAKYAGSLCDIQGNSILHYAAKTSPEEIVKQLVSFGLDNKITNISGDTHYTLAIRWKRPEIAALHETGL